VYPRGRDVLASWRWSETCQRLFSRPPLSGLFSSRRPDGPFPLSWLAACKAKKEAGPWLRLHVCPVGWPTDSLDRCRPPPRWEPTKHTGRKTGPAPLGRRTPPSGSARQSVQLGHKGPGPEASCGCIALSFVLVSCVLVYLRNWTPDDARSREFALATGFVRENA